VEAWGDFYRALKPRGMLSVSRWYDADTHRGEFYRLVAIAADALQRNGVPTAGLKDHLIALNVGNIVNVITRPDGFTSVEWQGRARATAGQGFKILMGRISRSTPVTTKLNFGHGQCAYFASLPENVTPSTDDNPFLLLHARFGDFVAAPMSARTHNNTAITMTFALIVVGWWHVLLRRRTVSCRWRARRRWRR